MTAGWYHPRRGDRTTGRGQIAVAPSAVAVLAVLLAHGAQDALEGTP